MARDDAEPTLPASQGHRNTEAGVPAPGKRQRAADLFSAHRYRAMQLRVFERRRGGSALEISDSAMEDDAVDPPLMSDAPAARAAREVLPGAVHLNEGTVLTPVPVSPSEPMDEVSETDPEPYLDDHVDDGPTGVAATAAGATVESVGHRALESQAEGHDVGASHDVPTGAFKGSDYASPDGNAASADDSAPVDAATTSAADSGPDSKPTRNSRNFVVATVVGLTLLGVTLASAWFHPIAFAVVVYGFALAAVIEWKRALERHGRRVPIIPLIAATVGLGVATHFARPEGLVVALLVGGAGVVAWRIGDERVENTLADSLAGVLTLLWIPFLASFLYLLELADNGWQRVFIVVLAAVGNDTGALVVGKVYGRRKLLERVSPAKTWEGAIGGVVVGAVAASVAAWFFFDDRWYIGAAVGAASAIAAVVGDLAESALKRDIRVKDMSQALPGHGGVLDRIDSLLFAAPVGYVVFAIFLGTLGGGGL